MHAMFKRWKSSWDQWVGDRDLELAIRGCISDHGYSGRSAKLKHVRLQAIERPGWVQVYSFTADVQPLYDGRVATTEPGKEPIRQTIFGVAIDDGRRHTRSEVFNTEHERDQQMDEWSVGLICRGKRGEGYSNRLLVAVVAAGLAFALYVSLR
jgi:hypothetical protein